MLSNNTLLTMKGGEIIKIYKNNNKVINLAKRVEKQSNIYKKQLSDCKNSLSTNKYIVF